MDFDEVGIIKSIRKYLNLKCNNYIRMTLLLDDIKFKYVGCLAPGKYLGSCLWDLGEGYTGFYTSVTLEIELFLHRFNYPAFLKLILT